jgi:hypothetical protein
MLTLPSLATQTSLIPESTDKQIQSLVELCANLVYGVS